MKRSRLGLPLVLSLFLLASAAARADSSSDNHYAGLQLGPSVHTGLLGHNLYSGGGVELSFTRWLLLELLVSGQAPPNYAAQYRLPGAVTTSLGLYSRIGGGTHSFVYGVGTSYSNRYECPKYCTLFSVLGGPEEDRTALNLLTFDVGLGYEARFWTGFFFRSLFRLETPVYLGELRWRDSYTDDTTMPVRDRGDHFFLARVAVHMAVGYAFKLSP